MNTTDGNEILVSPIADLSYPGYDGPLRKHPARWWIVALAGMRRMLRNPWFWALAAGSFLPYMFHGLVFYLRSFAQESGATPPGMLSDAGGHQYALVFFQAMSSQLLWLFGIALMVGAGCIASDNQANALQVYLSKPITKGDYLTGKWMGVFLTLFAITLAPALLTYIALGAAFTAKGYFTKEPWLIAQIVGVSMIPGFVHASLLVGFSAWSKSARMAGAFYAAFYYVGQILVGILWLVLYAKTPDKGILLQHMSVGGLITGLAQNVYNLQLRFSHFSFRRGSLRNLTANPPDLAIILAIALSICLVAVLAARWRIRAVEVVRG